MVFFFYLDLVLLSVFHKKHKRSNHFIWQGRDCLYAGIATHAVASQSMSLLEAAIIDNPDDLDNILADFGTKSTFEANKDFSLQPHLDTIDRIFSRSSVEEIVQLLEDEGGEFCGKVLKSLRRASPSSLKVAHRQLTEGASLPSLSPCLNMEYRLVMGCCANADFYEGVRAQLVDRDNAPKWKPATLQEVTDDVVEAYFAMLPSDQELNL